MIRKKCKHCGGYFMSKSVRSRYCSKACRIEAEMQRKPRWGQPCWSCKKARGDSNCIWMNGDKPVEGWKAKKTKIINADSIISSYKITYCPNYIQD